MLRGSSLKKRSPKVSSISLISLSNSSIQYLSLIDAMALPNTKAENCFRFHVPDHTSLATLAASLFASPCMAMQTISQSVLVPFVVLKYISDMAKSAKPKLPFDPHAEDEEIKMELRPLVSETVVKRRLPRIKEEKAPDFDTLLDGFLQTYQPKKRGRNATPELLQVQKHFDSIQKGVDAGVTFKVLATLLSEATGLKYTESKIRSQWTAEARKRGVKAPRKARTAA
jgi:hypothetical protein